MAPSAVGTGSLPAALSQRTDLGHPGQARRCAVNQGSAIILYDGECNLCASVVAFILPRDRHGRFRFAALQSDAGRRLLTRAGCAAGDLSTVLLVEGDRCWDRSDAALEICRRLPFPWSSLAGLRIVPRPFRDAAYSLIARERQRWFGRRSMCLLSMPGWEDRFLI